VPSLTARVEDATGGLLLVFPGRRQVPGLSSGMTVVAEGTVVEVEGRLAMINPLYEFVSADQPPSLEHQRS
jgi:DNA/RNA endonuclease YhcR with UshA esterase domain